MGSVGVQITAWRDRCSSEACGLPTAPQLAVADGALGLWKARGRVGPAAREQRDWVHKTAEEPKSLHPKAKRALQEIWMAAPFK